MRIIVFTGAGVSAESGLRTFRDSDGLWEQYRIEDVATPEAWRANPDLVIRFYNERYRQLKRVVPNPAHFAIAALEQRHEVHVVTQNVDDLHERAGSTRVLHLHGELTKCRSAGNEGYIAPMPEEGLTLGLTCPDGHQLRPHIVWFGEMVPAMYEAEQIVRQAECLIVVGTSLNVYPAAGLIYEVPPGCEIYLVDPGAYPFGLPANVKHVKGQAGKLLPELVERLLDE